MSKTPEPHNSPILDELLAQITPQEQDKVDTKMRIAVRLSDRLEELHMQKKQLAEACDVSPSMVTKWLRGGHNFTVDTLHDIAHALGMHAAELMMPERTSYTTTLVAYIQVPPRDADSGARGNEILVGRSSMSTEGLPVINESVYPYGQVNSFRA